MSWRSGCSMTIQKRKSKDIDRVQRAVNLAGVPQGCVYHDSQGRHFRRSDLQRDTDFWKKQLTGKDMNGMGRGKDCL